VFDEATAFKNTITPCPLWNIRSSWKDLVFPYSFFEVLSRGRRTLAESA
jgi:hypothetical protein